MVTTVAETILVVDDDEDVLDIAVTTLSALGYPVKAARNGEQALDILGEEPEIALLLTDIVMPGGMDGWDLAHHAKQLRPQLKVLYTSGHSARLLGDDRRSGYGPLLPKPWRLDQLESFVRRALNA